MAPLFVGSNSDDSRIRSDRVGLAASTSNPASAVTGDVYYNSTDNKLNVYDGSDWAEAGGGGTLSGIASGTIPNGATVIIHSDGKVGVVTQTGTADPNAGTPVVVNSSGETKWTTPVYDSTNNKVVIAYRDGGNSSYGTARVGTVSGTSISVGSASVFETSAISYIASTYDSTNGKVVIAYKDDGNNNYGTAVVGTVSGTSITFGTPVVFKSGSTEHISVTFDSTNGKVVIFYKNVVSARGEAIVGTVSGTSISFGSAAIFNNDNVANISATYDSTNGKVVVAHTHTGSSSHGKAVVGTVSGTSISFGSLATFNSAATYDISSTFDSTNGKVVIAYRDNTNNNWGTAIVGTVSATSISFGSETVFENANSFDMSAVYDSAKEKVVIAYYDDGAPSSNAIVGTVSGTSISFGSPVVFKSAYVDYITAAYDSTNKKVVIAYMDPGNSDYGTAVVFSSDSFETNLTSSNFIGFSDAAYSDGDTANIQIEGSVDDAQSGLTTARKHYVQNDGTLSTTAGDPSVVAGTAISGTKIIIET